MLFAAEAGVFDPVKMRMRFFELVEVMVRDEVKVCDLQEGVAAVQEVEAKVLPGIGYILAFCPYPHKTLSICGEIRICGERAAERSKQSPLRNSGAHAWESVEITKTNRMPTSTILHKE